MKLSEVLLFVYVFDILGVVLGALLSGAYPESAVGHYLFWICLLTLVAPVVFIGLITAGLFTRFRSRERKYDYAR